VCLNVVMLLVAVWFLRELAINSRATNQQILGLVERCLSTKSDRGDLP
jgi:hypothetical protein